MSKIPVDLGHGGSHVDTDLKNLLIDTVDSLNSVKAELADLKTKYNQHITNGKHIVATSVDAATPLANVASTISITK